MVERSQNPVYAERPPRPDDGRSGGGTFRVLPELRSPEPRYSDSMREVRLRTEARDGRAEVQGYDADDERAPDRRAATGAGRARAASRSAAWSAGSHGAA